ncbi:MAG: hypothetical protein AAGE94_14055 [Acidobacteriota bacterium]
MRSKLFFACLVVLASFVLIPSLAVASPMADGDSVAIVEDLVDFGQLSPWMTFTAPQAECDQFMQCSDDFSCYAICPSACIARCLSGRCLYRC